MTRAQARRRRKRRQRLLQIGTLMALILFEILVAVVPAGILAAILLPLVKRARGYTAIGGEWLLILAVFYITYSIIHWWICKKILRRNS